MRATLLILDSVGAGALPDAADWGDAGADTLGHVARHSGGLALPNLRAMGLGNLHPVEGVAPVERPSAAHGRAITASNGKDTISGHWEICGVPVKERFHEFPDGFPDELVDAFTAITGAAPLGNLAASGTVIIEELGREHLATGRPILYTSSDSVFQVAAHEEVVSVQTLHRWCREAFEVTSKYRIARVIARPFVGEPGAFVRTTNRHDFAFEPPADTLVDQALAAGLPTTSIGKVKSIFGGRGFSRAVKAGHNPEITQAVLDVLDEQSEGLLFANLVDFDMLYGHRRDPAGYAAALEAFDRRLPEVLERLGPEDLLILTADHGCDPTHRGSDHTREYVPVLAWRQGGRGTDLGTLPTLADIGASLAEWLGVGPTATGTSFLERL